MTQDDAALLRELYAGLAVVKTVQTEINRRLTNIEADMVTTERVDDIEAALEGRKSWWVWAIQSIGYIVMATAVLTIGNRIGLEVAW